MTVCLGRPRRAEAPAARIIAPMPLVMEGMNSYHFVRMPTTRQLAVFFVSTNESVKSGARHYFYGASPKLNQDRARD
jgi:hypothetical protein